MPVAVGPKRDPFGRQMQGRTFLTTATAQHVRDWRLSTRPALDLSRKLTFENNDNNIDSSAIGQSPSLTFVPSLKGESETSCKLKPRGIRHAP